MRKTKSEGITLIALVVTIIIILILAGVTISTLFGDNSIINQAKRAEEESKKSNYQDALDTLGIGMQVQGITDNLTKEEYFQKYKEAIENDPLFEGANITDLEGEEGFLVETKDNFVFKITPENVTYVGKIGDKGLEEPPTIAKSGIEFKHNPEGWTNKEIKVEITTTEKDFRLQYALSSPEKGNSWKDYNNPIEFKENGFIYARLVNNLGLGTNTGEEKHATHEVTQIDKNAPQEANIEIASSVTIDLGVGINVSVTQADNERESGINYKNSKWVLNKSVSKLGTEDSDLIEYTGGNFGTNEEQIKEIKINPTTAENYYIHILSEDNAGNRTESIKGPIAVEFNNTIVGEYGKKQASGNKTVNDNKGNLLTIPNGYTLVNPTSDTTIEYENKDNPTVDDGLVIKDDKGNEFVWVPVPDASTMYGIDKEGNYLGKIYDYSNITNNMPTALDWKEENNIMNWSVGAYSREPDVVLSCDDVNGMHWSGDDDINRLNIVLEPKYQANSSTKTKEDFKKQLQAEFKEMIESVKKYKGFYIGRYETGNISSKNQTETPVSQKYNTNLSGLIWYYIYANCKKVVADNRYATTSIIWGCEWDATMNWFLREDLTTYVTASKINGVIKGNYKDNSIKYKTSSNGQELTKNKDTNSIIPTGGSEETKVKNIYDMAGNAPEQTMEATGANLRTNRGGYYGHLSGQYPTSVRLGAVPSYTNEWYHCSRMQLYVK